MKKNKWTSTHKFLKLGLSFYILLLFSCNSISNITVTHAASLDCFPPNAFFCTSTPTSTFIPTATPIPTPISTFIPTPIPTPWPQPTSLPQTQPTTPVSIVPPLEPNLPEVTPIVIPTDTPSITIVTVTPHTTTRTDTTSTNQQLQNTADKSFNPVILSLGIGVPLLLATGGVFWFLRRKQIGQYKPEIYSNAQASSRMNNYMMPPTVDPQYGSSSVAFTPGASGALPTISTQPMLSPQPTYPITTDLYPATAPFSREMLTASLNNGASSAQNSLLPLLIDTPSLSPLSTRAKAANRNGQITTPLPPIMMDTPLPSMSSLPPVSPMPSLAIHPPSIKDDPMLEEVMRQAQMGLFILSGR